MNFFASVFVVISEVTTYNMNVEIISSELIYTTTQLSGVNVLVDTCKINGLFYATYNYTGSWNFALRNSEIAVQDIYGIAVEHLYGTNSSFIIESNNFTNSEVSESLVYLAFGG